MMYSRASVIAIPSRMVPKTASRRASTDKPFRQTTYAQIAAVASSINGYCIEIGSPQPLQRARSAIHDTIGMFSYHASDLPQRGHRERGRTTDCFGSAPQRRMQTLRKLPSIAPSIPARITQEGRKASSSSLTGHLVQEDTRRNGDIERFYSLSQREDRKSVV